MHTSSVRVHKNIKRRNTFSERRISNNNRIRCCFIPFNTSIGDVSVVANNFFFNKPVSNFHPAMTKHDKVFNTTTELRTNITETPPIVNYSLSNNSLSSILMINRVNSNLRIVNRNARCNNVNGSKHYVNKKSIFLTVVVILSTTIQVN